MLLPSRNQFCLVQKLFLVRFEILSQNWHLTSMYFLGERKLLPLFCDFTGHKSWIISCERHSIPSLLITSRYSRPKSTWVDMKKKINQCEETLYSWWLYMFFSLFCLLLLFRAGAHRRVNSVGTEQDFKVSKVITHPSYHRPTRYAHDIALLKLEKQAQPNRSNKHEY